MVTPTPWPDHILRWHPHPGRTIYYGDTTTLARPYTMVTPMLRPSEKWTSPGVMQCDVIWFWGRLRMQDISWHIPVIKPWQISYLWYSGAEHGVTIYCIFLCDIKYHIQAYHCTEVLCCNIFLHVTRYLLYRLHISYKICSNVTRYYCIPQLLLHTVPNTRTL